VTEALHHKMDFLAKSNDGRGKDEGGFHDGGF